MHRSHRCNKVCISSSASPLLFFIVGLGDRQNMFNKVFVIRNCIQRLSLETSFSKQLFNIGVYFSSCCPLVEVSNLLLASLASMMSFCFSRKLFIHKLSSKKNCKIRELSGFLCSSPTKNSFPESNLSPCEAHLTV